MTILIDMDDTIEQLLMAWVRKCNAKYGYNVAYEDIREWNVAKAYPGLTREQVIITSRKQMIRGDVLIDDGPHNLIGGEYRKILYDAPHNQGFNAEGNGMSRVRNWDEIETVIGKWSIE